ncbi:hypothetical protein DEJ51_22665 [Streptomyces venezuelae]|uniref:SHOCT domain-containing protein n=1 Tax=Streptomyces venezuelae TaxID=54571 RepID=A0A5P2DN45_STRVZ|nr:SHOCT domain-containing protein [Streptomyces venezuelae]QES56634.1 hypothetical protein DEJ51_22665 [Streptomyces venezuelae]
MFIRPIGVTVHAANRPPGHPLLRGLLARASGATEATTGAVGPGPVAPGPVGPADPATTTGPAGAPDGPPGRTEPPAGAQAEPEPTAATTPDRPAPAGLVAELTQLAVLAREGLLTPQEFTTAKARLLRG